MTKVHQFYGGSGAPFTLPTEPDDVVSAWRTHRARLRAWYRDLDTEAWARPTRCTEWSATDMAQHLISGAQFLGYTLHQARKGEATRFLEGFDAQATAAIATAQLDGLSRTELIDELERTDERVDAELRAFERGGWDAMAEAPPGHVRAHVAVNHFLFDSWVHERDLAFPTQDQPVPDPHEAVVVTAYVMGIAGIARAADEDAPDDDALHVRLADVDRDITIEVAGGEAHVRFGAAPSATSTTAASAAVVDVATGRVDPALVDEELARYLSRLATVMA